MKEKVNIDFLEFKDLEAIIHLVRNSFNDNHLKASIYKTKGILTFLESEILNKYSPYIYLAAKIDDKVVGFAEFKLFKDSSTAFLNMISTSVDHKGKGIANKLIHFSIEYFKELNFSNVQLDVFESNIVAKKWYEGLGFCIEDSNCFSKLNISGAIDVICSNDIVINNLGQFQCLYRQFGFSFLQVMIDSKNVSIGVIDNSFILRGEALPKEVMTVLISYIDKIKLQNVYYIGKEIQLDYYKQVDLIHRMKLII